LQTLAKRGSASGTTHDGWGVAFYQGNDVALFREPFAASGSPLVHFLECNDLGHLAHLACHPTEPSSCRIRISHGHLRLQLPSRRVEPPGLWWLHRECAMTDKSDAGISLDSPAESLLVASVPLTDDLWQPVPEGDLLVARAGRLLPCSST
jgi:predicted glutamine amidotransferase